MGRGAGRRLPAYPARLFLPNAFVSPASTGVPLLTRAVRASAPCHSSSSPSSFVLAREACNGLPAGALIRDF